MASSCHHGTMYGVIRNEHRAFLAAAMPKCCERWVQCWMFSVPWLWKLNTNLGTSCGQTVLSRSDVACLFPEETCQVWCEGASVWRFRLFF